jgi:predicted aspartyl protease
VPLQQDSTGSFWVSASLNGDPAKSFVLDTGASFGVVIPSTLADKMKAAGKLTEADFLYNSESTLADGRTVKDKVYKLHSLTIGNRAIKGVPCSVGDEHTSMPLGTGVLSHFSSFAIDNKNSVLVLVTHTASAPPLAVAPAPDYTVPATASAAGSVGVPAVVPTATPVAAPAAVPAAVTGDAPAPAPQPMSPAQQAASTTQAYAEGHADRVAWEAWFNAQSGSYRSGADHWAGDRNNAHPVSCTAVNAAACACRCAPQDGGQLLLGLE